MSPTRWQKVKEIVAEALDADPRERSALIAERCDTDAELRREVESLLPYANQTTATVGDLADSIPPPGTSGNALIGRTIGPYRIQQVLGEGGMGSVYLAHREVDGYAMPVALKIIRSGSLSEYALHRFRRERQILARLSHPNITHLLDGGVTGEGLPYLVTEYVQGVPLDEFVRKQSPSLRSRLTLFLDLCTALAFAHRNLVVHGDIKPGNILVTLDGVPKLLDFGIARLLDPDTSSATQTATFALTPAWASPEQLRGEPPSIPGDLYSLGRVFYELITGRPPFDLAGGTPGQILNVLGEAPPLPSSLSGNRELAGDLDNIALKAIDFEPLGRYSSADQFAEDVRRHLESRPILARKPTLVYRAVKFARRHRAGAAGAAAAIVAITIGLAMTLWQARIARLNAERAIHHAESVRKLANSFIFELDDTVAELPGATKTRAAIMSNAVDYLDRLAAESSGDDGLQHELAVAYMKIGDIQGRPGASNLGRTAAALESYRRAQRIMDQLVKKSPEKTEHQLDLATIYIRMSALLKVIGSFEGALEFDRKALGIREALFHSDPNNAEYLRNLAQSYTNLGGTLWQLGDSTTTLEVRRKALALYQQLNAADQRKGSDRRGLALAHSRLGGILLEIGNSEAALAEYRAALALEKTLLDEQPGNAQIRQAYATAMRALGRALVYSGDHRRALEYFEKAQAIYEAVTRADQADVRSRSMLASTRVEIARALMQGGRPRQALPHLEWALETREQLASASPLNAGARGEVAEAHAALGDAWSALADRAAARQSYERSRLILTEMTRDGRANAASTSELRRVEAALARLPDSGPR